MASVARDKEGEVFGPETADLERGGEKLEPAVEATYKRNKTHVETNPAKAPEELFETDASNVERGPNKDGGQASQHLVEEELTASDVHLVEEEQVTASDVQRGPDPGGGQV